MKRRIQALVLSLMLLFSGGMMFAPAAYAVDVLSPVCSGVTNASDSDVCKQGTTTTTNPIIQAISVVISILAVIIGVASVIVIILSGFKMITSNGDAQQVASARSAILYALIGIVVAVLAGVMVAFVLSKL